MYGAASLHSTGASIMISISGFAGEVPGWKFGVLFGSPRIPKREPFPVGGLTCLPETSVAAILQFYPIFDR